MKSTRQSLFFDRLGSRQVQADFSGGHLSSDAGALLLRQVDEGLGVSRALAGCFTDRRDPLLIDHTVRELICQRVEGLALGFADLNDHDTLRLDPLLAVAAGKVDPLGEHRLQDKGVALAGSSTLNRLERSNDKSSRYHKISHDPGQIEQTLLTLAVRCLDKHALEIVLDLDSMGHLVHGLQEGRHFSAYYDGYCYQPLYVVCGPVVLWAQLRQGDTDPKEDVLAALAQIIPALRRRCPKARIVVRGDSGFCREELMAFCEGLEEVYYILGLAQNPVLVRQLERDLFWAAARRCLTGLPSHRLFREFEYRTLKSWSRARRVAGKAEVTAAGPNPRFVVTNLPAKGFEQGRLEAQTIYEQVYCPRGNMENVLKQQTLDLRADRLSAHGMAGNQLRLWLATCAYLLIERTRALGLRGTELASATAGTIRLKLFKVAASVQVSVRRVYVQMSSAYPLRELFGLCLKRLRAVVWETS